MASLLDHFLAHLFTSWYNELLPFLFLWSFELFFNQTITCIESASYLAWPPSRLFVIVSQLRLISPQHQRDTTIRHFLSLCLSSFSKVSDSFSLCLSSSSKVSVSLSLYFASFPKVSVSFSLCLSSSLKVSGFCCLCLGLLWLCQVNVAPVFIVSRDFCSYSSMLCDAINFFFTILGNPLKTT